MRHRRQRDGGATASTPIPTGSMRPSQSSGINTTSFFRMSFVYWAYPASNVAGGELTFLSAERSGGVWLLRHNWNKSSMCVAARRRHRDRSPQRDDDRNAERCGTRPTASRTTTCSSATAQRTASLFAFRRETRCRCSRSRSSPRRSLCHIDHAWAQGLCDTAGACGKTSPSPSEPASLRCPTGT